MSESVGNNRKRYVDHPRDRSKLTCLIHGHGQSSDKLKALGEFGTNYAKVRPPKVRRWDPATKKFWKIAR